MAGVRIRRGSVLLDLGLVRAIKPLWIALLLLLPAAAQAQFTFTTNNGAITITGYTGPGGAVTIPGTTNGYPVTSIGYKAFFIKSSVTSVTIPDSVTSIGSGAFFASGLTNVTIGNNVTNIGDNAFEFCGGLTSVTIPNSLKSIGEDLFNRCTGLTSVTIGNSVTSIGYAAFAECLSLTSVTIGDSVTNIGLDAFFGCTGLTNVTIPNSVTSITGYAFIGCQNLSNITIPNSITSIGTWAFHGCSSLTAAYFLGNAPSGDNTIFSGEFGTVYYLPGTTGWGSTFGGWPTGLWYQPIPMILGSGYGLGATTNGFGFTISWATNLPVVVEACTNLANPLWNPVATNTLTGGTSYFSDPQWTDYPGRFYRLRSP